MNIYIFSIIDDTPNNKLDSGRLTEDIQTSSIVTALDNIGTQESDVNIYFKAGLSTEDLTTLSGIVGSHSGEPLETAGNIRLVDDDINIIAEVDDQRRLKVSMETTAEPHTISGSQHIGLVDDAQLSTNVVKWPALTSVSGVLQNYIDSLDFYSTAQVTSYLADKADVSHRHDDLYYTKGEVNTISGTLQDQFAGLTPNHDELLGLGADDHPHYHDDTRGDARYFTKSQINGGQLNNMYYTESEVDSMISAAATGIKGAVDYLGDLPASGTVGDIYIVNVITDPNNEGFYRWDGSDWAYLAPNMTIHEHDDRYFTKDEMTTGSGNNIFIQEHGVLVDNTPHTTIDFDCAGVSVTDEGNGVAKVTMESGVMFGVSHSEAASEDVSSTTSKSYQRKLRLTTENLSSGKYRIGWYYEWRQSSNSQDFLGRVQINDSVTLMEHREEPRDSGSNQWHPVSGFDYHTGSGVLEIDVDFCSSHSNKTSYIRRARLEIWRIS